jgi:molybdopterin molybdotransferase
MEPITFDKAYDTVMSSAFNVENEIVSFTESLNRVLSGDVKSDMYLPPFDKATVDGFACRREDLGHEMEILETIAAGMKPGRKIAENKCSRIMTGAEVPEGADMVFMVEDSEVLSSGKVIFRGAFTKENISLKGEDIEKGDVVLHDGTYIKPQDIAVMASVGCTMVNVSRKIRVTVISSGDELVEPSEIPGISQIRNSNAYQLMAQIDRAGATGKYLGIAKDDKDDTFLIIKEALTISDIVIITGGVSMGDFDFIPSVLEKAGVEILFSRVRVQPGKPTTFGVHPDSLVFGLPGNPVSSFVQFELMVRPLIYRMMGYDYRPLTISLAMEMSFSRRSADRLGWIPVKITKEGLVSPVEYHGSAHISSLVNADGFIGMEIGKHKLEKGEVVSVRHI